MRYGEHAAFVDALRACLDLDPLYNHGVSRRTDAERFGAMPIQGDAGYNGDGGRRTARRGA